MNCSDTQLVDYWKNPDIDSYSPGKILVVGLTDNAEARLKFEVELKEALEERGFDVAQGNEYKILSLGKKQITNEDLNDLETTLIEEGFDTILLSYVTGSEDKIAYKSDYDGYDETYRRFKEDYLRYQDVFYNPDYYDEYTIFHAETAMYCICPTKDRELLWKGYIQITDPRQIDNTVSQYVNLVLAALEELSLIDSTNISPKPHSEALIN